MAVCHVASHRHNRFCHNRSLSFPFEIKQNSPSERVCAVIVSSSVTSRSNFVNQSLHMSSPICQRSVPRSDGTLNWPAVTTRRALSREPIPRYYCGGLLVRYMWQPKTIPEIGRAQPLGDNTSTTSFRAQRFQRYSSSSET